MISRIDEKKIFKKLADLLEPLGYTTDPRILPQIKNYTLYHKIRRKMFSGSLPSTVSGLDDVYEKVKKNHNLFYVGFWSVYPVLFTAKFEEEVNEALFYKTIKQLNKDIFEFRPYTAKCIVRVTIWPKIEIMSHPRAFLLIFYPDGFDDEKVTKLKEKWYNLQGFEKFGIIPPVLVDLQKEKITSPLTFLNKYTPYPPSLKQLEKSLFG